MLRETNQEVAIKVQRPGVEPNILRDLFIFRTLVSRASYSTNRCVLPVQCRMHMLEVFDHVGSIALASVSPHLAILCAPTIAHPVLPRLFLLIGVDGAGIVCTLTDVRIEN